MRSQAAHQQKIMIALSQVEIQRFHQFSLQVADATKNMILELWRGNSFAESLKEDQTAVTVVDLKAEELAREMISKQFPAHGIMGEEYESINPGSDFQWTIDPIDGTQNLVNRIPTFGTLIGLRFQEQAILGVIDHPVMDLRISGGVGIGVSHSNSKVVLPDIPGDKLSPNDLIATNSLAVFGRSVQDCELFSRVLSFHPHSRIYYDCYAHTLAILGRVAVVVEPNLKIWDVTPVEAMITELGGGYVRFGDKDSSSAKPLINSVFGKRKAVKWMCSHLRVEDGNLKRIDGNHSTPQAGDGSSGQPVTE